MMTNTVSIPSTHASVAARTRYYPPFATPIFNLDDFTSPEQFQLVAAAYAHKDEIRRVYGLKSDCPFCH